MKKKYVFIGGCADGRVIETNKESSVNVPSIRKTELGEKDDIIETEFCSYYICRLQFTHKYEPGIFEKAFYIYENLSVSQAINLLIKNYTKKEQAENERPTGSLGLVRQ